MTDKTKTVQTVSEPAKLTEGQTIWNEIKDKPINVFGGLTGHVVSSYCAPVDLDPSKCFLRFTASAVLPALETSVGPNYVCEAADKFIIVSRKSQWPVAKA